MDQRSSVTKTNDHKQNAVGEPTAQEPEHTGVCAVEWSPFMGGLRAELLPLATMEQTQELGATSASAETLALGGTLGATKTSIGTADTKLMETTAKEGMSLIDRFYNGGNRARPAALDILVVVLDGVVRRMRQQYATRQANINEGNAQIARIDASVASIKPKQDKLRAELEEKKARAAELKAAVAQGESVILDSVDVARAALEKASLLQRSTERNFIAGLKLCAAASSCHAHISPHRVTMVS